MSAGLSAVSYLNSAESSALDGAALPAARHRSLGGYRLSDVDVAIGSTLGGPKATIVLKASGALQKVFSVDAGAALIRSFVVTYWDEDSGVRINPLPGTFTLHPEHQEHQYLLGNGVAVSEDVFVRNGGPRENDGVDPAAVYFVIKLKNESAAPRRIGAYAFCEIDGTDEGDVVASYDERLGAIVAWNEKKPEHARIVGCARRPTSYETTIDHGKAVGDVGPGRLSNTLETRPESPLGVLHFSLPLGPGEATRLDFHLGVCAEGRETVAREYAAAPQADVALAQTRDYYHTVLGRSIVLTPNAEINRGALWAKANMLRVQSKPPSGWGFTNSPTVSSSAVGRDTFWFALGSDYITPEFSRASLLNFVRRQEPTGMMIEFYNMLDDSTNDFGLNINDNTPLFVLALWHHYQVSGDEGFLREVYPAAVKAVEYIASQRNAQGLVWCTSTKTGSHGMIGWRNIIKGYRLSGATTEVNSECYGAFIYAARMARAVGAPDAAGRFDAWAAELKAAINEHLLNPQNGLYYLNIDIHGSPRSDVTSDLVFPVIFEVSSPETSARIVRRLMAPDFWTEAGMRTTPHDAPRYSPDRASGLFGGVWTAVCYWYAFCASRFLPESMSDALTLGFSDYARDPRRSNTVPGQFSEWLHGETLVNQGMMLSPWFPPRYVWAAVEGAGGLSVLEGPASVAARMPADWKWCGVCNLPYRGESLTWFMVRTPAMQLYANHDFAGTLPASNYEQDISAKVRVNSDKGNALALRSGERRLLFVGNTDERSLTTALTVDDDLTGTYRVRLFDSLVGTWSDGGSLEAKELIDGHAVDVERRGFILLELSR